MNRLLAFFAASITPLATSVAAVSATQPSHGSEPTLLILPIEPPTGTYGWVGRAIQQDMLVDLTHTARARVLAPPGSPALDSESALRSGREAGADYVVYGSAQSSGAQLRVTGQLLEVSSNKTLSGLKATAPVDNLFPLEDALAMQVARALPSDVIRDGALSVPTTLPTVINEPYVSETTPAPQYQVVPGPDYTYDPGYAAYPYAYPPDYYYPGYAYGGLGWWGPGVVIVGPHRFGDHFHHFDNRNFISPHINPGLRSHGFSGNGNFFRGSAGFGGARGGIGGGHMSGGAGHAGGGRGR